MTTPIWMAAPPEVHSALLSSGPGPGPLLASAGAWSSLSTEYAAAADELIALLGGAQAGVWEGPTAQAYAAAHAPYLSWLMQASADSAATATQQETAASAYTAALASMPTLGELAANHATHALLLATNFFGINTIPIALNEADYVRMWIQAATTMSAYQGVSTAAVAASPRTTVAPAIEKEDTPTNPAASSNPWPSLSDFLTQLENVINNFGAGGQNESLTSYLFGVSPGTNPLSLILGDTATDAAGYPTFLGQLVGAAGYNPVFIALAYAVGGVAIVYDLTTQILQFFITFPLLLGLAPLAAIPATLAALGAGGIVGIAEIAAHLGTGAESIAAAPTAPVLSPAPTTVSGPAAPVSAPAAPAPAFAPSAPAAPAFASPSAPGAPPPPSGTGPFPYLVGGTTRMAFQTSAKASAKRKAPEPDIVATPAAAAAASAREQRRARRHQRAEMLGRDYQYADMDDDIDQGPGAGRSGHGPAAPATASDRGAETLGFAGTTRREAAAEAAGLTTLAGDAFADGPREPMMPSTWAPETTGEANERRDDT